MSDVPVSEAAIGHPDMWSACNRLPPLTAEVALGEVSCDPGVNTFSYSESLPTCISPLKIG